MASVNQEFLKKKTFKIPLYSRTKHLKNSMQKSDMKLAKTLKENDPISHIYNNPPYILYNILKEKRTRKENLSCSQ